MDKYKKLINNSLIFAIGNFGSKIVSIILVPLYTYYLTTTEYGTVDMVTTTTTMLLPIISLSIYQAVFRFTMDNEESNSEVFTNSIIITSIGAFIALLFYPILSCFDSIKNFLNYIYLILIIQAFQNLIAQYTRAIGKIRVFAFNGILQTLILGISNIILLLILDYGIGGYLMSIILSNIVSIIYLASSIKIINILKINELNLILIKKMLKFSIPLIPNSFMWWLINASNRYFIIYFKGMDENGLFSVANKIPTLLILFTSIFSQAWQLSAIDEYDSKDKSKFYSKIYNFYFLGLVFGTSFILMMLKVIINKFLAVEYFSSWEYVPFLLLGVVFSSLSGFLGTNYVASKETKGAFNTSLTGAIIAIVANVVFVPYLGAIGAGLSTMISFAVVWIVRIIDTSKYIIIEFDIKEIIVSLLIIAIQIILLFLGIEYQIEFFLHVILILILICLHKKKVKKIIQLAVQFMVRIFRRYTNSH